MYNGISLLDMWINNTQQHYKTPLDPDSGYAPFPSNALLSEDLVCCRCCTWLLLKRQHKRMSLGLKAVSNEAILINGEQH
jgi:hypothetical protein